MRLTTLFTNLKLEAYILHNERNKNDTDLEISSKTFFSRKMSTYGKIFNLFIDQNFIMIIIFFRQQPRVEDTDKDIPNGVSKKQPLYDELSIPFIDASPTPTPKVGRSTERYVTIFNDSSKKVFFTLSKKASTEN